MKLNLNGIEIELPNNAKVDVSKDGKTVKIDLPEAEVKERIRVVEASPGEERVVERIKVVEVEKYIPCMLPHYPCNQLHYPNYTWPYTYTSSGQIIGGNTTIYQSGTSNIQATSGYCQTQ